MKLNTSKEDLDTIMRDYEAAIVYFFLDETEQKPDFKMGSGGVWLWLETQQEELHKSRASVIFSLNRRVDDGIMDWEDETGKGGHHRLYKLAVDREGIHDLIVTEIIDCLDHNFGDALKRAVDAEILRRQLQTKPAARAHKL